MKFYTTQSALALSLACLVFQVNAGDPIPKGCYKKLPSSFEDAGPFTWQSKGHCKDDCKGKGVMALHDGSNCFCGDEIPATKEKTDDTDCDTNCDGFPEEKCRPFFLFPPLSTFFQIELLLTQSLL